MTDADLAREEKRCKWCRHAEGYWAITDSEASVASGVDCKLHGFVPEKPCPDYEREPGADDE